MSGTYAIIPARGGSEEFPRRNLREIKGVPLVGIATRQAQNSEAIDEVIVNSDDKEIRDVATEYGAVVFDRPDRFARGDRMMEVDRLLSWQVTELEEEDHTISEIVVLYPTSPLRTVETIDKTVRKVTEEGYDSALTLHEDNRYLWQVENGTVTPTNYDPQKRGPQLLEDWNQWVETKSVYVVDRDLLIAQGSRVGGEVGYVEMPRHRSINIDTDVDFKLARFIAEVDGVGW
jgi:CMP-N-acetylneuraminic acid synthetase